MKKVTTILLYTFVIISCSAQAYTILGNGANAIDSQSYIFSIAADGLGNVFAGGGFPAGGIMSGHVQKWNGNSWAQLATADSLLASNEVRTVITDAANNVYAAGDFLDLFQAGFLVAKWNGSAWSKVNNSSNSHYCNGTIFSLAHDNNSNIYATEFYQNQTFDTSFFYVAKWDGTNWADLGAGPNPFHVDSIILSVATDGNNNVYAAGEFGDTTGHKYVAYWNGSTWSQLGGNNSLKANDYIFSVTTDIHNNVYAAGMFTNNSGNRYIAKWDGNSWTDLGNSANNLQMATPYSGFSALCSDAAGNIYAAGALKDNTGYYVARWNGTSWYKLYTDSIITSLCVDAAQNVYGAHAGIDYIGITPKGYVAKLNFPGASGIGSVAEGLSQFSIYPNPSLHQVVVTSNTAISNIEVFNTTGQLVFAQQYTGASLQANIDISNLVGGIYFICIKGVNGGMETRKMVKE